MTGCARSVGGVVSPNDLFSSEGSWPMIVEYIRYRLPSERCAEFERAYGLAGEPLLASPHCLAYELTRCAEDPGLPHYEPLTL
jgi:hypothetical protein